MVTVMTIPAQTEQKVHPRYQGRDRLLHIVVVAALAWGTAYLVWRAMDTEPGAQPVMFAVLYACEVFGLAALASFAFLAWRIPSPDASGDRVATDRRRLRLHV